MEICEHIRFICECQIRRIAMFRAQQPPSASRAEPQSGQQVAILLNAFASNFVDSLNDLFSTVEASLVSVETRLQRLEQQLTLLEVQVSKLSAE